MARPKKIKAEEPAVKTILVDPPSGWLYGFPKAMPADTQDVNEWLVQNGYPRKQITLLGEYFHVRFIDTDT